MASRVDFAVSCTPVCAVSAGENLATETIAADVAKNLGSAGSVTVTWGTTIGYASGAPVYPNTSSANNYAVGQTAASLGTFTDVKFVYIKHTGYLYSSSSAVGAATTAKLKVTMAATIANATTLCILNPGESILLPFQAAVTPTLYAAGDGAAIAVEIMATAAVEMEE